VGLQTDEITITDNAAGGTQGITVTGNGVLTGGSLLFTPSELTFAAQTIGTTSPAQTALLINNGNKAVTITNITAAAGYAQTNNCGSNFPTVPATLNVGQTCSIAVSFTPTTTGTVTGSVSVASNAVKASTALQLTGTGSPVFSLSSNARSSVVLIGSRTATFTISAAGPSTFQGAINLTCSSGATCTFSPTAIAAGGSSTLTLTGLSSSSANPLNFTVTGNSGSQGSSAVSLTVFFADYSLAATPSGTTVTAGKDATYTITVTPVNGFNQAVLFSCGTIPEDTACYWNPGGFSVNGTQPVTTTLTITTEAEGTSRLFPRLRPPRIPPAWPRSIFLLALLAFLGAIATGLSRSGPWMRPRLRLVVLLVSIALLALGVGCENYVNPINITPYVNGTPAGTVNIVLSGTLGNGSGVNRTTTVSLSVLPTT
jgi:hypothetical protein